MALDKELREYISRVVDQPLNLFEGRIARALLALDGAQNVLTEEVQALERRLPAGYQTVAETRIEAPETDELAVLTEWFCRKFEVVVTCDLKNSLHALFDRTGRHRADSSCLHPVPVEPLTVDRVMEMLHEVQDEDGDPTPWYCSVAYWTESDTVRCVVEAPGGDRTIIYISFADRLTGLLRAVRRAAGK